MLSARGVRRSAGVFRRGEKILVHPVFRAETGLSLTGSPVISLPSSATDDELGDAVIEALSHNRANVKLPASVEEESALLAPLLSAAGVKSWSTFSKGAFSVWVEHDAELSIIATRRTSSTGAYVGRGSEVRVRLPASASEIGSAVRQALALCE